MPPIDASIPLQATPINPMGQMGQISQSLSSLANMQTARVQAQQAQMQLAEQQKFSSAMQDPNAPFKNPDGTIDQQKLSNWTSTNTPLFGTKHAQEIQAVAQNNNAYQTARASMADTDRQRVNSVLASFMGPNGQPISTPQDMVQQLQAIKPTLTGAGSGYVDNVSQGILHTAQIPGQQGQQALQARLGQFSRDTVPAAAQAASLQQSTMPVQTGAGTAFTNVSPAYGQAPGSMTGVGIAQQISPSERQTLTTDAYGNPMIQTKTPQGQIVSGPGVSTGAGGPAPLAPGDLQAIPILASERAQTNAAAQQVPNQRYNNQQILNLTNDTTTGPGTATWNNVMGRLGLASHTAESAASQYQLIGHAIAQNSQSAAASMGVTTDAARHTAGLATGTPEMNREALRTATQQNDALQTGVKDFNTGMEAAIQASGGDIRAKRDFQKAWTQNYDVNLYMIRNALESGDQSAAAKILKSMTPDQQSALAGKQQNLNKLIQNGKL